TVIGPGATEYVKLFRGDALLPDDISRDLGVSAPTGRIISILRRYPAYLLFNLMLGFILLAYLFCSLFPVAVQRIKFTETHLLVASYIIYFLVMAGGVTGCSRFRHSIMPFVSIYAGYGLYLLVKMRSELSRKQHYA
ncbi:MAG: hypothetical protein QME74_00300, partial [Candidatus Edwardsbacteria bacterium]|nr:hypothetical protein [Candidatus Edwardsbacteria bacterium]